MDRTFDELVAEADAAPMSGWDFSWLEGRATEERPSWAFSRLLHERLGRVDAALDLQTGGGEVLAAAPSLPRLTVATEGWPPNVAAATARLHPRGVAVVAHDDAVSGAASDAVSGAVSRAASDGVPLPFGDAAFELVTSRHPVVPRWAEIARVLRPGGTYLAQHVGPASVFELVEHFLGPQPAEARRGRDPEDEVAAARAVGLELVDLRAERLRIEFHDVGAVVWFLRKVVWMVPGFTAGAWLPELRDLHEQIAADGPFVAHSTRHLIELRRP